ncbi:MAG TPA: hypothetical protein VGQ39_14220 [Pyrinomonadaceae bacterium]|nr:hypothetical protein [Pyrinomonadaceae bacterium]
MKTLKIEDFRLQIGVSDMLRLVVNSRIERVLEYLRMRKGDNEKLKHIGHTNLQSAI